VGVYLIAVKPTDSVLYGFLPAARRPGLELTVVTDQPEAVTDQPEAHERVIVAARAARSGAIRDLRTSGAWEITPEIAP
jgi:hypothetical protein